MSTAVHLALLTASAKKSYRACPRLYQLRYVRRLESVRSDEALRFGSLIHAGLEALWRWWMVRGGLGGSPEEQAQAVEHALEYMRSQATEDTDAFELARAEELLVAYAARWGEEPFDVLAVEVEFSAPLRNPETGAPSRTFRSAGKIDVIVRDRRTGRVLVVEHKTSSEDVSPGAEYWVRLRMDGQVSDYYAGAEALGYDVAGLLYDVLSKPGQKPLKATPVESRKYKAGGQLYANQRDRDETPDEFRERVRAAILADPAGYFARAEVPRLEAERQEHALDTWQLAGQIREAARTGCWPRNPDACTRWGRSCAFLAVCSGETSIDDPTRYRTREVAHPELSDNLQRSKEETSHAPAADATEAIVEAR